MTVDADGLWTLAIDFGEAAEQWASVEPAAGEGRRSDIVLSWEKNEGKEARSLILTVASGGKTASATFTQNGSSGSGGGGGSSEIKSDIPGEWLELPATDDENLYYYVLSQLRVLELAPEVMEAGVFLVESLNQNGWLDEPLEALAADCGCPPETMEKALEAVQSLEPAGVGARSLSECLKLQLVRRQPVNQLAVDIAEGYLDALSKSRYGLIARELKAGQEEVRRACDLIRSLNPRPGTGFAARENLTYINPDIIVVSFQDHFELLTNDYYFPTLNISGYYTRLLKESDDEQVKDYLPGKVRQAKWMVKAIEQRRSTLMACAECILELQEDFFRKGPGHLVPLSLADVAGRIGVHESTVSRAVKDKYIQCSMGVYPLSYFFSRGLGSAAAGGEDASSPDAAKALLKKLIAGEDRKKPLSDQKLCQLMTEQGCPLSRRTVAKYRDELHIPSTAGRKVYE